MATANNGCQLKIFQVIYFLRIGWPISGATTKVLSGDVALSKSAQFPQEAQRTSHSSLPAESFFQIEHLIEYVPFYCGACESDSDTAVFEEVSGSSKEPVPLARYNAAGDLEILRSDNVSIRQQLNRLQRISTWSTYTWISKRPVQRRSSL